MELQQRHIDALDNAETLIFHCDFCPYLELKELFRSNGDQARTKFRSLFTKYYGLNVGGLTDEFKDRFFDILFGGNVIVNGYPDFCSILAVLNQIPRRQGDYAMPFLLFRNLSPCTTRAVPSTTSTC